MPIVLGFLTVIGLYRIMAFNFLSASAAQSFGAGVEGYTAPFSPDYLTLTWIASGRSGIVAWAILLAFIAVIWLEITIAILIVGRAWLAWGLDRMGPKWFTDVSPQLRRSRSRTCWSRRSSSRSAWPSMVLWLSSSLAGLVGGGLQFASVFLVTGISALALPVPQERARHLGGSPYQHLETLVGIPLVTIGAVLYLTFIVTMLYYSFIEPTTRLTTGKNLILFVAAWVAGMLWYFSGRPAAPEAGHRRQHHLRRAAAGVTPARCRARSRHDGRAGPWARPAARPGRRSPRPSTRAPRHSKEETP